MKFLRVTDIKEHLGTTACESNFSGVLFSWKHWLILLLAVKAYLITIYSYFFTPDLILQSYEIFSPAIVSITVSGNEKNANPRNRWFPSTQLFF